jgi:hypothetical protein
MIRTLLRAITYRGQHVRMDPQMPEDDPVLRPVWVDMSAEERLAYLLAEGETPPAGLTEAAQRELAEGRDGA